MICWFSGLVVTKSGNNFFTVIRRESDYVSVCKAHFKVLQQKRKRVIRGEFVGVSEPIARTIEKHADFRGGPRTREDV
jgi:hypothetical protein